MTDQSADLNKRALVLFERALDVPSNERADWIRKEAGADTAVSELALNLLARDTKKNAQLDTGGALRSSIHDEPIPKHIGAYDVTGLIGRGGMGAVYRGARSSGDFEHDVAIKVIRPGVLSDKLITRFENERQTLAKLSHPHIARLYDGGTLSNGAPFIVMEYVNGLPINDWVAHYKSSKQNILRLFKRACYAVSYAHQNLIIHRDITPSNVLVDMSGQVKLIDFGIAKPIDEPSDSSSDSSSNSSSNSAEPRRSLESMTFTPGFAAPELMKGDGANILSDIFSLGQLLDKLLTALHQDTDLKAIIAKATEANPDHRYHAVDSLIDDLDNYMSGFPVSASQGGTRYRMAKFLSRHTIGAIFAGVSLAALITGFVLTTLQYQRAESARQEADKRFNDVRSLAATMMNDIYAKLYRVPGTTDASIALIQAAQKYLDELASETNAPDDVKLDAAVGYTKLGTMAAGTKIGSVSNLEEADAHFATAEDIFLKLDKNQDVLTAFGKLYYYMAEISIQPRRQYDLANEQLIKSIELLKQAELLDESKLAPRLALMHSQCYLAEVFIATGKTSEAKDILNDCIADGAQLFSQFPNNEAILRLKSASARTLANALSLEEDYQAAIPILDGAIKDLDALDKLIKADNDSFTLRAHTIAYWRRGYALSNIEEYETALADYSKALEYNNIRLTKDPADKDANWFYYTIIAEQANPLQKLGRYQEAESGLLKTLEWYEKRHAEIPNDSSRLGNLFLHHYMMADFYKNIKLPQKECWHFQSAYDYYELIEELATASNWDKEMLKSLKVDAVDCAIDFKY